MACVVTGSCVPAVEAERIHGQVSVRPPCASPVQLLPQASADRQPQPAAAEHADGNRTQLNAAGAGGSLSCLQYAPRSQKPPPQMK